MRYVILEDGAWVTDETVQFLDRFIYTDDIVYVMLISVAGMAHGH